MCPVHRIIFPPSFALLFVQITIELSYLKSFVNMGQASVTCESGCTCDPSRFDAHGKEKTSLVRIVTR